MSFAVRYLIAYGMDLIFGDPEFLYHPVRAIGKLIKFLEDRLYDLENKRIAGGILVLITLVVTFMVSYFFAMFKITEIYFLYTTLATKCLGDEGLKVYKILKLKDIERAKKELSYLVSRDTGEMEERQIIRSIIETIAENSVDGVLAPMFFAVIGSLCTWHGISLALPFAMTYKAINTIDSMIGYKNDRYMDFGTVGAKIDDLANFIPARLSGIFIIIGAYICKYNYEGAFKIYKRDRLNHGSPNSGHPEACFAGALGLQFGGKTKYFGKLYDKPTIGDKKKDFSLRDILKARKLLYSTSFAGLVIFIILSKFSDLIG